MAHAPRVGEFFGSMMFVNQDFRLNVEINLGALSMRMFLRRRSSGFLCGPVNHQPRPNVDRVRIFTGVVEETCC